MQVDLAEYDTVVHSIYDAALQPARWDAAISRVAQLFEASRGVLFTWAHSPEQGGFSFTHNLPQSALELWAAKSMYEDPFIKVAVAKGLMGEGSVVIGSDLVPMDVVVKTDFYKQLWEPVGIAQVCCGMVFDATDAHKLPTALSLFRGMQDLAYVREHADVLRRLLSHFSRSLGVMFHLRDTQLQLAASLIALDRLSSGVVLVDATRKVQFANRMAQNLFIRADTVQLGSVQSAAPLQMRLHHRLARFERGFQKAIAQALQPLEQDAAEHFSQAVLLPAEDGRPACVVHAMPLAPSHGFATGGPLAKAIVFIYDLQSAASVEPTLLCELFEMTQAEARAALQITQGGSIEQMAARLGVAPGTFKTQLQAAYMKSSTHRQADLLKLLLALASH